MVQNWDSCLEKVNNASLGEKKKVTAFFSFNFQEIVELEDLRSSHFTSSALRVPLHQWYRWKQLLGKMLLLLNHQPKPRPHIFCLYWLHYLVGFFFFFFWEGQGTSLPIQLRTLTYLMEILWALIIIIDMWSAHLDEILISIVIWTTNTQFFTSCVFHQLRASQVP